MVTSIQLNENVKEILERLKEKRNESYEDVIIKLIRERENDKGRIEKLLIEECKEMAEENIIISKDWEGTLKDGLDRNEKWDI